jgi:hypothetical protein
MLEIKNIDRLSMKNICLMLNLKYEAAKQLKKKDIVQMVNNKLTVNEMLEYNKQKQIKGDELDALKPLRPKKVQMDDEQVKQYRKEHNKIYFQSEKGKLALQKSQKKYYEKKKQNNKIISVDISEGKQIYNLHTSTTHQ